LTNSDIGRHLKNGEVILTQKIIPKTNFYSYTYPDFPFNIHHWLSGVVFYVVYKIAGFDGLSIFYILLSIITFMIFFKIAEIYANKQIALIMALISIPLLGNRIEIRPEIFSYLFCAFYFKIMMDFYYDRISFRNLYVLALMQLLWVNLHIYFIFGIFIVSVFFL